MSVAEHVANYQSYRGLPQLAGLATISEAVRHGLSVEACVARLKRYHYAFRRLHEILTDRITAEPIYELKTGFSHHSYLCAEHVQALRTRIGEMREPPLGLEEVPHPALKMFFDEIMNAPSTAELLVGVYEKALPALDAALARHQQDSNPIADAPSLRVCRFARLEIADMLDFGEKAVGCLVDHLTASPSPAGGEGKGVRGTRKQMSAWLKLLDDCLHAAAEDAPHPFPLSPGGRGERGEENLPGIYSTKPHQYDPVPRRDERFQDLWNQGVNAESFIYNDEFPAQAKCLMMLYKRIREIDVPEMMASIICETRGKPWEYYRDMSRQLWDEARHAMLGEVGFVALGIDWRQARITHNWSTRLNTECNPIERHAVLYFIEQGLMSKTGKRYEWETARASGIPLMATIQDYDWADEVLHSQIGRQWYIPQIGDWKKALEYGDQCWSRILSNWRTVLEQGLTGHENWWPNIYLQACRSWGARPDDKILAFAETYEDARADLKGVTGSA